MALYGKATPSYLDAKCVMFYGNQCKAGDKQLETACYLNGFCWICPDPKNDERAQTLDEHYVNGIFLGRKVFWLNEEQYQNFSYHGE